MEVSGKRIETDEGGSGDKPEKICEICLIDNITIPATGVCRECREHMCNSCFKDHLKAKSCRHHVLVDTDVSSLPFAGEEEGEVKCTKHKSETVRFYCRKHEVVGCGDCMVFEHKACDSEYINNVSKHFQQSEDYKMLISKIEKLTSENKENEDTVQEKKRENRMMLEKVLGDINKFRLDINKYLDKVEADVIYEAKHIMSEDDELLAKLQQDCKLHSSKIDEIKQMLHAETFKDNRLFINTVECKPNVSDIENTIAEIQMKKTKTVKFVCDEQLRSIVTSTRKLGTFDISSTILRHQTMQPGDIKSDKGENKTDKTTDQNGVKSAPTVVVGSRVKGFFWGYGVQRQRGYGEDDLYWDGTVTAVHSDGSVSVRWDNGSTGGPYTVGLGLDEVRLI